MEMNSVVLLDVQQVFSETGFVMDTLRGADGR